MTYCTTTGTPCNRLEQVEDDLADLDRRFYDLEKTADLDAALSQLVARLP